MMRQVGNGLPHRGHAFSLQGGSIKLSIFDSQGGLVADGDQQFQIVFSKRFDRSAIHDPLSRDAGAGRSIDIDCTDDTVATLHGYAHGFVDA